MNDIFLQIVVVIVFIVGPFWLINKMDKKGSFGRKDATYVQIRNMLREILLPLAFAENEKKALGDIATYKRDIFLVELYFDYREKQYLFFCSSGVQDPIRPPRQISVIFSASEYNIEKKNAIRETLRQWLKTLDKQ
jgi:hypothetical protein